jgi:hypothetical protein
MASDEIKKNRIIRRIYKFLHYTTSNLFKEFYKHPDVIRSSYL